MCMYWDVTLTLETTPLDRARNSNATSPFRSIWILRSDLVKSITVMSISCRLVAGMKYHRAFQVTLTASTLVTWRMLPRHRRTGFLKLVSVVVAVESEDTICTWLLRNWNAVEIQVCRRKTLYSDVSLQLMSGGDCVWLRKTMHLELHMSSSCLRSCTFSKRFFVSGHDVSFLFCNSFSISSYWMFAILTADVSVWMSVVFKAIFT